MGCKLCSLFDGSGGFQLAATMCGIDPVSASEVEPYPIAVTRSRFPKTKHLGSVTEVKGSEVEPVDVITFGSPCQDLSVAGKRAGLKHTENGDEETTRSGLFMEAVRVIKEMREATNGRYPTFAVWENVPGAFSSNKGEDFRTVLEELIKIVEPSAVMPAVPKGGWPYADHYCGDGWSLAYRVLDAQFWGVPQRRRRIYLVFDLRGERAGEILFKREGLRGYSAQGGSERESSATDAERGVGADDREGNCLTPWDVQSRRIFTDGSWPALYGGEGGGHGYVFIDSIPIHDQATRFGGKRGDKQDGKGNGLGVGQAGDPMNTLTGGDRHAVCLAVENDITPKVDENGVAYSLRAREFKDPQFVCYAMQSFGDYKESEVASGLKARDWKDATDLVAIDRAAFNQGQNALYDPQYYTDGTNPTLVARGPSAVAYKAVRYIVRRLTPTERARLQGFPDAHGHPDHKEDFTDEEYAFWTEVRCTHAVVNGKEPKTYSRAQMVKWYNGLHTDSSEYKMWGNGIALPCALYVMQGISDALERTNEKHHAS